MKTLAMMAVLVLTIMGIADPASAGETPISKRAYLYIGWPNDGEIIRARSFRVWFGLRNVGVAPAGVKKPNTGHHHLIIDAPLPPDDEPIPHNRNHIHLGSGQTETRVNLSPGRHTLQLLFADHKHIPHRVPAKSKRISFTIVAP